ncbi:MAG: hypothetical protein ABEK10_00715 [Candidatus Nanosalina sp.]
MTRKQKLLKKCREEVDDGNKVSVRKLSQELSWLEEDVHRLLNSLEKDGDIETYTKEVFGSRQRFVSVYR